VLDGSPREADSGTHCQGNKAAEGCFRKPDLWVAQPELLKYLRGLPETVECALMIGHNPGLHDLALALADTKSRKRLPPAEGKFPTEAMAAFRFEWRMEGIALEWRDRLVIHQPKGYSSQIAPSFTVRSALGTLWRSIKDNAIFARARWRC